MFLFADAPIFSERYGSFTCQKSGQLVECVAAEGATGDLECTAFGNPKPIITFEARSLSSGNVQFDAETGDVIITRVSEDNKGIYTCTATNSVKQVQRTYSLLVGGKKLARNISCSTNYYITHTFDCKGTNFRGDFAFLIKI